MKNFSQTALTLATIVLCAAPAPVLAEPEPPPGATQHQAQRLVMHVDETPNARWALMLARAYLDDNPGARLVVVTYGPGVDFLLHHAEDRRGNPYDPAVSDLVEKGVSFRICGTTLSARKIAREDLLDKIEIVPSGIAEIVRLQLSQDYAYLKP